MNRSRTPVFISYCSKDVEFARKLSATLESEGLDVWIDWKDLRAGDAFEQRIERALDQAASVVVVLSPDACASEWVRREVALSLSAEARARRRVIYPILLSPCQLPAEITHLHAISFVTEAEFDAAVDRLIGAMRSRPEDLATRTYGAETLEPLKALQQALADDGSFEMIASLPLSRLIDNCIRVEAFSEKAQAAILIELAMGSNGGEKLRLWHLFSISMLLSGPGKPALANAGAQRLLRRIVEELAIDNNIRRFALKVLVDLLAGEIPLVRKEALLPDIFRRGTTDGLLENLFSERAPDGGTALLARLWAAAPRYYREEILLHLAQASGGRYSQDDLDATSSGLAASALTRRLEEFEQQWAKQRARWGWKDSLQRVLQSAPASPAEVEAVFIELSRVVPTLSTEMSEALGAISSIARGNVGGKWSDALIFDTLIGIATSPSVNAALSAWSLCEIMLRFGGDALLCTDRLPMSLFALHSAVGDQLSIVHVLLEGIVGDETDASFFALFLKLLELFDCAPLRYLTEKTLKLFGDSTEQSDRLMDLRRFVLGELTLSAIVKRHPEVAGQA